MKVLFRSSADHALKGIVLLRIWVGWIFVLAGLRKFLEPEAMGPGRMADLGVPFPEFMGYFVGGVEMIGGLLLILGLLTKLAVIPLAVVMLFAILLTKILDPGITTLIEFLHAIRLDSILLVSCVILFLSGSGFLSLDHRWSDR